MHVGDTCWQGMHVYVGIKDWNTELPVFCHVHHMFRGLLKTFDILRQLTSSPEVWLHILIGIEAPQ